MRTLRLILCASVGHSKMYRPLWRLVHVLLLLPVGCTAALPVVAPTPLAPSLPATATATPLSQDTAQSACAAVTAIPRAECEALVTVYHSTDGPHWKVNSGWLSDSLPCQWHGVTCTDGVVEKLNLSDNGLRGTLPAAINGLCHLRQLYLHTNELQGPIPESIGDLTEVRVLLLNANQFSGPIPESIGNLRQLLVLYLDANRLSGPIPATVGNLAQVRYLYLQNNRLQGSIPASLGDMRGLQDLHLYQNQLQGPLPLTLAQIPNLQHVKLQANDVSLCLPAQLEAWAKSRAIYEAPPGGICQ